MYEGLLQRLYKVYNRDQVIQDLKCYGRLAVVSDVDGGGVCPECQQRKEVLPCYIEASTTERCWDRGGCDAHKGMNALSKRRGVY
jgi:hypothetical protein